ncbi:hypothetical protein ACTQ15_06455, partial [Collinsella sp. LCP21S3_E4]|uniref:hypothetical protein n=1 Tax=Collinsella sp. LCP21S3_E4 TaxID=3438774 RepID=UPI003F92D844
LEEPDRRLPGHDVVFHSQVDTHKKPPISRVQEMGGSSTSPAGAVFGARAANLGRGYFDYFASRSSQNSPVPN